MGVCLSQQLVDLYLSGSCSQDELQEIETHLTQCESCRKQIESSRSTIASDNQSDLTRTIDTNAAFEDSDKTRTYIREDEDTTKLITQTPASHDTSRTSAAPLDSMFEGYDVHEQLPVGGQAVVYKATQKATKRTVALKVLLQGPHASMRAQYRFEREVDLAASLQHPNIVTIYDSGIAKGQYWMNMWNRKNCPFTG
jgi:predicted anti-sigma-YlaC factor YlaD